MKRLAARGDFCSFGGASGAAIADGAEVGMQMLLDKDKQASASACAPVRSVSDARRGVRLRRRKEVSLSLTYRGLCMRL